jgi:hypothetical protein
MRRDAPGDRDGDHSEAGGRVPARGGRGRVRAELLVGEHQVGRVEAIVSQASGTTRRL